MPTTAHRILALTALIVWKAMVPVALAQTSMHVTPVEIAQLPRFCWGQLDVPGARGEEFTIGGCGPAANHYCSALIYMIRAKGRVSKTDRQGLLGHADVDVRYTEKAIADYPNCPIRENVAGTRSELNTLMTLYGIPRPHAQ